MVTFTAIIKKFGSMGEKTGWTYVEIPSKYAESLNPGVKTSYRVKGKLDELAVNQLALIPMGEGDFIIPLNADMRKNLGKRSGNSLQLALTLDNSPFSFSSDFIACLEDEPGAKKFFDTLPGSHQRYFSKWIDSAKTDETKPKRIAMAVTALAQHLGYAEMIRANKKIK